MCRENSYLFFLPEKEKIAHTSHKQAERRSKQQIFNLVICMLQLIKKKFGEKKCLSLAAVALKSSLVSVSLSPATHNTEKDFSIY
jgi:hypothetical protein